MNGRIIRLPIYISEPMHTRFKQRCLKHGLQMQEAAELIMKMWLSLPDNKAFPKKQP